MGLGDSVTQTIFFIAALVLATATVGMTYSAVQGMTGDVAAHAQELGHRLRSDLRVINDPAHVTASPLTLLVKNVGDEALHPTLWTVLVDGTAYASLTVTIADSADNSTLAVADVAQVQVNGANLAAGDHDVRVVDASGVADEFQFHG